jgi:hypothetical protein
MSLEAGQKALRDVVKFITLKIKTNFNFSKYALECSTRDGAVKSEEFKLIISLI